VKQTAVLIITHGNFGIELLKSLEMIIGEQQDAFALGLCLGNNVDELRDEAEKFVCESQEAGKEVVILVDILGGSPSNIALYMAKKHHVKVVTGVNMPMVIELFSSRESKESAELLAAAAGSGAEGIHQFPQ
jgi:Phosphotransferase system, mannose/fructose-specific component IIA